MDNFILNEQSAAVDNKPQYIYISYLNCSLLNFLRKMKFTTFVRAVTLIKSRLSKISKQVEDVTDGDITQSGREKLLGYSDRV